MYDWFLKKTTTVAMKVKKGGAICELKSRKEADSSIGCCLGKKAPYPKMVEVSNTMSMLSILANDQGGLEERVMVQG